MNIQTHVYQATSRVRETALAASRRAVGSRYRIRGVVRDVGLERLQPSLWRQG
jgi:hypothetical protein